MDVEALGIFFFFSPSKGREVFPQFSSGCSSHFDPHSAEEAVWEI